MYSIDLTMQAVTSSLILEPVLTWVLAIYSIRPLRITIVQEPLQIIRQQKNTTIWCFNATPGL